MGRAPSGNEVAGVSNGKIRATTRNLRSVWTIPTQPYKESHFAVMPRALVERCILAGTSEHGCCATCGAPWERVVESERWATRPGNAIKADTSRNDGGRAARTETANITTGWRATCTHDAPRVPCTVLDPFAGSGTVGDAASRLCRNSVLIELSPVYARLIRKRMAHQLPLFAGGA